MAHTIAEQKIRVLISKVGLDGHDRGAKIVASMLRDAGMEVIYLGRFQTPENIVRAAIEEDADVIGLSCLSGVHLTHTPKVVELMQDNQMDDVLLIVGGVFPVQEIAQLKEGGVDEVFMGSLTAPIVDYIRERCRKNQHHGIGGVG